MSAHTEDYQAFLAERRSELLERIAQAAAASGRDASQITLLAVSKTVGPDEVAAAVAAGYDAFGENRPQELVRKREALDAMGLADLRIDMIGNLQRNKINQVIGRTSLIHSGSSEHLLEGISKRVVARPAPPITCLIEVNVSGEATKSGMSPEEAREAFPRMLELEGVRIGGLMTMAPAASPDAARRTFAGLRELRDGLERSHGVSLPVLSCGMSDDFDIAVEEGSTLVRLGRIVFDQAYAPVR